MPRTARSSSKTYKGQFHKKKHKVSVEYLPKDVYAFFDHFSVKTFFFIVLLFILAFGEWKVLKGISALDPQSFAFAGALERFEGNSLWLLGAFSTPEGENYFRGRDRLVQIKLSPHTSFRKVVLEESPDQGKLRSRVVPGSLQELSEGEVAGVYVMANENIYDEPVIPASEVRYATESSIR